MNSKCLHCGESAYLEERKRNKKEEQNSYRNLFSTTMVTRRKFQLDKTLTTKQIRRKRDPQPMHCTSKDKDK